MDPVSFDDAATLLYGLSPAEFTAARDELVGQARAAGQKDVAAAIKKLGRPTVSAWLVNLLTRQAPEQISELLTTGESLRTAQQQLDGEQLRELSGQRRRVIAGLVQETGRIAAEHGQPAGAALLREVETTLDAAVVDPHAAAAVAGGLLVKPLAYAGVGGDGGDEDAEGMLAALQAVAAQRAGRTAKPAAAAAARSQAGQGTAKADPAQAAAQRRQQAIAAAEQAHSAAAAQAAEADDDAADAEHEVAGLAEQRQFLARRIETLERELAEAEAEQVRLSREHTRAQRVRDAAARTAAAARRQLQQAEHRLASLRDGSRES